jgi:hypothetical protein
LIATYKWKHNLEEKYSRAFRDILENNDRCRTEGKGDVQICNDEEQRLARG